MNWKVIRDDLMYLGLFLGMLGLLVFSLWSGYSTTNQNHIRYQACQNAGGVPVWTKDNVLVCVEAKRESERNK